MNFVLGASAQGDRQINFDANALAYGSRHTAKEWSNYYNDSEIEGSQFLDDYWSTRVLIAGGDTISRGLEFRYNIYARQMKMRTKSDTLQCPQKPSNKTL